jgi:2-isopropylmalate synthase
LSNYVKIFDTTLRDGEQSPGASMNKEEKIRLAQKLAALGVDIMECGFPAASPGDFEAVKAIAQQVKGPVICGLARTRLADIDRCWEAVKYAETPRIHTFVATSDIHLEYKLKMTREEVLQQIKDAVTLAKSYTDDVEFSAEDASRSDPDFLLECFQMAVDCGANTLNIPDTVGYALPTEFHKLTKFLKENLKNAEDVVLSVHCHDDLGLAVANSLAGVEAGARQVEVCVNGIGERAGNASLEEIVMAISTRAKDLGLTTGINKKEIVPTSRLVTMITGIVVQPNKAIVGANAFAHEAGIHVDGVLKQPLTYEILDATEVGLERNSLVLGKHSGRAGLKDRISGMGYELEDEQFERLFEAFKRLADKKKEIFNEDLEALIVDEILRIPHRWSLDYMNVVSGTVTVPTATVKVAEKGEIKTGFGSGNGPVDAVYNTIRNITGTNPKLLRFTINAITGGVDAQAEVTVRLKEDENVVLGKASDSDIVIASAKAFINGMNRLSYMKEQNGGQISMQDRSL